MAISTQTHASSPCMPAAPIPRVLYLHERDGWYYFKRKIPAAIQWAFGGAKQIWKSLETSSRDVAVKAIETQRKSFDAEVARARQVKGAAVVRREQVRQRGIGTSKYLLDAHIEPLLDRFEHAHLITDDEERNGLSVVERAERHAELESALAQMLEQAATEDFAGYEETAQELLTGEQLLAPPGSAVRKSFLQRLLQRDIHIVEVQLERLRGRVTPTAKDAPPPPRRMPTMLDILEHWASDKTNQRTVDTYRGFVAEFEHVAGALPCVAIQGEDADTLVGRLAGRECSRETAENYLGGLATIFRHGITQRLVPQGSLNPFEHCHIDIAKRARSQDRRGYELAELNVFFTSRLYTSHYRPQGQVSDAGFWAPLVAAFTGGRIEELCQASVQDVSRINGVWTLRIAELDEGQAIKTEGSWRYVPIHEELIRCGFLVYVASVRGAGKQQLFPTLRNDNKYKLWSNALGKWFSRYIDSIGLTDDRLCFHSFRFSFRQWCTHSGISDEVRDALTGHWVSDATPGRGYMRVAERQYPFPLLVEAMQSLHYGGLDLKHLYVADPMKGVEPAFGQDAGFANGLPAVRRKRASGPQR